jgi:ribosomal protein S18 acetylase RimI-like enzyme
MKEILADLSPAALARSVRANLYAQFRFLGRAPVTDFLESEEVLSWHTPLPIPTHNGVLSLQGAPRDAAQLVAERLAHFRERQVEVVTWWFEEGVEEAGWEGHLRRAGFQVDSGEPGMAIDLQLLPEAPGWPASLEIRPVQEPSTLRTWVRTGLAGFGMPAGLEEGGFALLDGMGLALPMRHYLGYADGEPVATASLFLAAGVAGIYNVSTVPAGRGRGVGRAMTLASLLDARRLGYRVAILQSTEIGFSVYRRLGFEQVCEMNHYTWRSDLQE